MYIFSYCARHTVVQNCIMPDIQYRCIYSNIMPYIYGTPQSKQSKTPGKWRNFILRHPLKIAQKCLSLYFLFTYSGVHRTPEVGCFFKNQKLTYIWHTAK